MKDIKNYLEKQAEISKELNDILISLDTIENKEKELLYQENEKLLTELNSVNNKNVSATNDRIAILRERVNTLLSKDDINKDPRFKNYLVNLNSELISLSIKVNGLNEKLSEMSEKHDKYMKQLDNKTSLNKEVLNKETLNKPNIQNKKVSNNKISNNTDDKFEFKIGSNILNILGVILILVALITFGKYVYTYYMTDTLKGIFLFMVSSLILILGEKIFAKKIPKFAIGISALGVGGLYASLIVNYLVLETINSITAIILTLIITGVSLLISSKNNSNIIRIIALIGGYGCLMPMNYLDGIQSYITIMILLIISISNTYVPIKHENFSAYSSILNVIFCAIISSSGFLEEPAMILYLIITILFNNLIYIKACKEDDTDTKHLLSFITTLYLMVSSIGSIEHVILIVGLIYIAISIISYCLTSSRLKNIFYCHGVLTSLALLSNYSYELKFVYTILLAILIGLTVYLTASSKDKYLKILSILLVVLGLADFIDTNSIIEGLIYIVLFSSIIWLLSDKYKNDNLLITLKNCFFLSIIWLTIIHEPFGLYYEMNTFLVVIISIIYVLKITHIERLRHNNFKYNNKIILIISLIVTNFAGLDNLLYTIVSIALSGVILILLTNSKYIESKFIKSHSSLIYSIYTTYGICLLSSNSYIDYNIKNLLLSICLMIFAFINVWAGFKLNISEVRKYGLILSLLICAKLIIIDFYSYDFIVKTGLFLITGIVALVISYVYSKLEQELKNKDDLDNTNTDK